MEDITVVMEPDRSDTGFESAAAASLLDTVQVEGARPTHTSSPEELSPPYGRRSPARLRSYLYQIREQLNATIAEMEASGRIGVSLDHSEVEFGRCFDGLQYGMGSSSGTKRVASDGPGPIPPVTVNGTTSEGRERPVYSTLDALLYQHSAPILEIVAMLVLAKKQGPRCQFWPAQRPRRIVGGAGQCL